MHVGTQEMHTEFYVNNLMEGSYLENWNVDGWIILKLDVEER
jgi:hypothetical protein